MLSAALTGAVIMNYEDAIEGMIILASFIPVLMDTCGNAGSQAATLVIRSIALGEIEFKNIFKVIWKEFQVSIGSGLILGVVNFLRIIIFDIFKDGDDVVGWAVAIVVSVSLFFTVILAKFIGSMLPFIAMKIKMDPAVMSAPLITTIGDVMSLLVFFHLATTFLGLA
jgi:magnesium transporter